MYRRNGCLGIFKAFGKATELLQQQSRILFRGDEVSKWIRNLFWWAICIAEGCHFFGDFFSGERLAVHSNGGKPSSIIDLANYTVVFGVLFTCPDDLVIQWSTTMIIFIFLGLVYTAGRFQWQSTGDTQAM